MHLLRREVLVEQQPGDERGVGVEVRLTGNAPLVFRQRVRGMIGRQVIKRPFAECGEHRHSVGPAPQRGIHLHPAPILVGQVVDIEVEVVRGDLTGDRHAPLSGRLDEGQSLPDRVMAQLPPQLVLFNHREGEPGRRDLALGWPPLFVRGGPLVFFEQQRVFAVETDVAPLVPRQRPVELLERGEEQIPHAVPHVDLVGNRERQGAGLGTNPGVEGDGDRHPALRDQVSLALPRGIVDRGDPIVRHVGDVHHPSMDGGRRGGREIFLVVFEPAHVVAGVNMDVAHPWKDQAVLVKDPIRGAQVGPHFDDLALLDSQLPHRHPTGGHQATSDNHDAPLPQTACATR